MSELQCPVCKNDSYLNPGIKMYVSPCFHKICESCLYKHFQQGYAPCPECGTLLRRINFISSTFEDVEVEREIKMRKLMNRYFNRQLDDFESEREYNDYLEEYENQLFELLEFETEAQAKDKINLIRNSESILNSISMDKKYENQDQEIKKVKTAQSSWCVYNDIPLKRLEIKENSIIPKGFIYPYLPGGLEQKTILDFISFSLSELVKP